MKMRLERLGSIPGLRKAFLLALSCICALGLLGCGGEGSVESGHAPTAAISSPSSLSSFVEGDLITFTGSASDPEDGNLGGGSLVWTSSLKDGAIGTGTSLTLSDLSVGIHTITLTATDSAGKTGKAVVTITISPVEEDNESPNTAIFSPPADDLDFSEGDEIFFGAYAFDPEDGILTGASLVWDSSLDGPIGTGISFKRSD